MDQRITLGNKQVKDVRHLLVENPCTIGPDEPIEAVLAKVVEDLRTRHVYVIDKDNRLMGSIRMNSLVRLIFPYASFSAAGDEIGLPGLVNLGVRTGEDVMEPDPFFVYESSTLNDAAKILISEKINELPVVDGDKHIVGQINFFEILMYFLNEARDEQASAEPS